MAVDEALVPKRDAQWVIFSKFRQTGARVVVIDKCFNDLWKAPIIVSSAEGFAASVFLRGYHNQLREPHMAMQVEQDWLIAGKPSGAKAMITGRQHVYPSVALGQKGANARRIILDGQEMPLLEPVLGTERGGVFDELTSLVRAIRYETRPKEDIHARLIEIWHDAQSLPYQPVLS